VIERNFAHLPPTFEDFDRKAVPGIRTQNAIHSLNLQRGRKPEQRRTSGI
jgi:hypothetical protein